MDHDILCHDAKNHIKYISVSWYWNINDTFSIMLHLHMFINGI